MNSHIHKYRFETGMADIHMHTLMGYTDCMIGFNSFHFHYFYGISSYSGHTHYYSGITGLPVKTENGHIHRMDGILEINRLHEHSFDSYTQEDIAYKPDRTMREAYV